MRFMRHSFLCLLALIGLASTAHAQDWVSTFNGAANSADVAKAMTVDDAGNAYITGLSYNASGNSDIITIKYSPAGVMLWSRIYNGPANLNDSGKAIAVDSMGNVYVTGESNGGAVTGIDYVTLKYSSAGLLLWFRGFTGPGNRADSPVALALKGDGAVLVTGYSTNASGNTDYVTIKYGSDGMSLWARRYNGPANGYDFPNALKVDSSGNVYVTGASAGVGTNYDYCTIKYSSEGGILWSRRYNGVANGSDMARAITVDNADNVYVTGQSDGGVRTGVDIVTLKYTSAGATVWAKRYTGPGANYDFGSAIAVDSAQNVFVTGDSDGGVTGKDFVTIRYDNMGNTVWVNRFDRGISDSPVALFVNDGAKVYVAGNSIGAAGGNDMVLIAYNPDGTTALTRIYNGPLNGNDLVSGMNVTAGGGNIYLCGYSDGGATGADAVVVKYSP